MDASTAISTITAAIGQATELTKLFVASKADEQARAKIFEMQAALAGALGAIAEMQREVDTSRREVAQAKEELLKLRDWTIESQRYALTQLSAGTFVYAIKESAQGVEPAHYICAHCHQQEKKSILQNASDRDGWTVWRCWSCKSDIPTNGRGPFPAVAAKG